MYLFTNITFFDKFMFYFKILGLQWKLIIIELNILKNGIFL